MTKDEIQKIHLMVESSQFLQSEAKKLLDAYHLATDNSERKEIMKLIKSVQSKMIRELNKMMELG